MRGDNSALNFVSVGVHKRRFQGLLLSLTTAAFSPPQLSYPFSLLFFSLDGIKMGCFYLLNVNEANRIPFFPFFQVPSV